MSSTILRSPNRRSHVLFLLPYYARRWSRVTGGWIWKQVREQIKPVHILLTVALIPVAWYVYTESARDVIIIDSVNFPKDYEERGYTSAVMTLRIAERLQQLERSIMTDSNKDRLLQSYDTEVPDIEVPPTKLSLQTVVHLAQQAFHHEPEHIRGEITLPWPVLPNTDSKQSVIFWYHIYKDQNLLRAEKDSSDTRDPDQIVQQYAEGLLKRINPLLWAEYLGWDKEDLAAAQSAAHSIIANNANRNVVSKAYTLLGNFSHQQDKPKEAIEKYRMAIELNPKYAFAYNSWGLLLAEQGKWEEAVEKYRKAIELNPKNADAYNKWGVGFSKQGKRKEAIEKYRKAIELDPKYIAAYANLGLTLAEQGKWEEAIENYRKAIELDPNYVEAYNKCGIVFSKQGMWEEAIENYRKAIELDPKFVFARLNLNHALDEQRKREGAKKKLLKAQEPR